MSAIILDTLEFAAKLKAGGFTDQQAETQARVMAELIEKQLSTKQDVQDHEANLRSDIERIRADLKREIEPLRAEVKRDIADAKSELIRWVVGVSILQSSLIIGILAKIAKLI